MSQAAKVVYSLTGKRSCLRRETLIDVYKRQVFSMGLWCLVGGLAGAKLLYVLVEIKAIMENPQNILKELTEGFVVYGGIIGGILTGYIYSRVKKVSFIKYFDLIMPSIALAQAFGRIGCFLSGCCYGCETSSWCGVVFNNSPFAPIGVRVIPTQLISSAANFLHFFVLIWFAKRAKSDGQVGGLYLIFYSIGRFLIEILRNDPRGEIGFLSTSQFISIFTLILGIALFVIATKKWKKMPEPETAGVAGRDVPPAAYSAVRSEDKMCIRDRFILMPEKYGIIILRKKNGFLMEKLCFTEVLPNFVKH